MSDDFASRLARQSWPMYAVGMTVIIMRWVARVQRLGVKGLQADDYLMLLVAAWYTTLIVSLNVVASGGGSNLLHPGEAAYLTPAEIREKVKGSKLVILSEQANLNVMYSIKTCMLFLYHRLTTGLWQQRAVQILAVYVACGFIGSELGFFFSCRPFHDYWAVPPSDPQCATLQHYAITEGVFNITSDLFMLAVVLPLVFRVRVPPKQKFVLCIVFGLGIFVIIAAILTKVFNFSDVYSPDYMFWYTVQASVAVYVANLPMIWALLRQIFPFLRFTSYYRGSGYKDGAYNLSSNPKSRTNNSRLRHAKMADMTIGGHAVDGAEDLDNEFDGREFQMPNCNSRTVITDAVEKNGTVSQSGSRSGSIGTSSIFDGTHGHGPGQSRRVSDGRSKNSSLEPIDRLRVHATADTEEWLSADKAERSVRTYAEESDWERADGGSSRLSSVNADLEKHACQPHQFVGPDETHIEGGRQT